MLKKVLKETELQSTDSFKTAFVKGMVEGALEGLVIVGLITTLAGMFENKK